MVEKTRKRALYWGLGTIVFIILTSFYLISKTVVNGELNRRETERVEKETKEKESYNKYQECLNMAMAKLEKVTEDWCKANGGGLDKSIVTPRGFIVCKESTRVVDLDGDRQVYETEMAQCESKYSH